MISLCFLILVLCYPAASENSTNIAVQVHELPDGARGALIVNSFGSNNNVFSLNSDNITEFLNVLEKVKNNNNGDNNNSSGNNNENEIEVISPTLFSDCAEATKSTGKSGVYNIKSSNLNLQFKAYCMVDPNGGSGWTIIQRRQDGSVNFNQNWTTYETGFGNLNGEHFLGLKTIHALTSGPWTYELWIQLETWQNRKRFAKYGSVNVGGAVENYPLRVSKYTGDAGDQFLTYSYYRVGFSTYDNDNDQEIRNCAKNFEGGWWYRYCPASNLNGLYKAETGIAWHDWRGVWPLKYTHMAIRPIYQMSG